MRKYLKFTSVGGGAYDIAEAGDFVFSLDDFTGLGQSSNNGLKICMNAPYQLSGSGVNSIAFTVTGSGDAGQVIWNAMSKAITAAPGGNIDFILPEGYAITSWQMEGFFI
jgi:hypothetical protein